MSTTEPEQPPDPPPKGPSNSSTSSTPADKTCTPADKTKARRTKAACPPDGDRRRQPAPGDRLRRDFSMAYRQPIDTQGGVVLFLLAFLTVLAGLGLLRLVSRVSGRR